MIEQVSVPSNYSLFQRSGVFYPIFMNLLNPRILLFEDKLEDISQIEHMMKTSGYEVFRASAFSQNELRMHIWLLQSDVIISHDSMSHPIIAAAQRIKGKISIIILGTSEEDIQLPSLEAGKMAYLKAPFSKDVLNAVIDFVR